MAHEYFCGGASRCVVARPFTTDFVLYGSLRPVMSHPLVIYYIVHISGRLALGSDGYYGLTIIRSARESIPFCTAFSGTLCGIVSLLLKYYIVNIEDIGLRSCLARCGEQEGSFILGIDGTN